MSKTINGKFNLTTEEAAEYLGLSSGTLRNYRHKGREPEFITDGHYVFYSAEVLTEFKEKRDNRKNYGLI